MGGIFTSGFGGVIFFPRDCRSECILSIHHHQLARGHLGERVDFLQNARFV